MKVRFIVEVELPHRVTLEEMRQYIEDEVKAGVGQLHPADPLFDLDRDSVKVTIRHRMKRKP